MVTYGNDYTTALNILQKLFKWLHVFLNASFLFIFIFYWIYWDDIG